MSSIEWWQWLSIPAISAAVGYGTNVVALQMTFKPQEFWPRCLEFSRPKGQPLGLLGGWQGIVPAKAGHMAWKLSDVMVSKLIDVEEMFSRIDAQVLASKLEPGVTEVTSSLIAFMMRTYVPGSWELLPESSKDKLSSKLKQHSMGYLEGLLQSLRSRMHEVLDIRGMSERLAEENKAKTVKMFKEVGGKEIRFIERSGIYFGLLFGVVQAAAFSAVNRWYVLAAFGFFVGAATNWIALQLIFKPLEEKRVCGMTIHGLFLKRQREASDRFAELAENLFINSATIWNEVLTGARRWRFREIVHEHTSSYVSAMLGPALMAALGQGAVNQLGTAIADKVLEHMPRMLALTYDYQDEALDLRRTFADRLKNLPPEQFERILHPAFEQDEWKLVLVGGVLGFAAGAVQTFIYS